MLKQATSVVKSTKRSHTCKFTLVKCFTELLPALDKVYWCLLFFTKKIIFSAIILYIKFQEMEVGFYLFFTFTSNS